jgi:hypothetical protein
MKKVTISIFIFTTFLFLNELLYAQPADTAGYLPQIKVDPDPGFGPYVAGTHHTFSIMLTDLPQHTSKVVYRFIDVDGIQVGESETQTGTDMYNSVWSDWLDYYDLPLSPQFHVAITYQIDSIANYYFPFVVYPDTVSLIASAGWGPFISNDYSLVDGWNPVANQYNSFRISNLPPRTEEVDFSIIKSDSGIVESFTVTAPQGQFLDSAHWNNILMTNLPLNTMEMKAVVKCNGGPDQGLLYSKPLSMVIQKPALTSKTGGVTLNDSIQTFIHKPSGGQALHFDSVKYAIITNGPGVKNNQSPYYYRGPYSLDMVNYTSFTIEAWVLIDGVNLAAHQNQSMSFMRVDSLFDVSFFNDEGISASIRVTSLIAGDPREIAYMDLFGPTLGSIGWHHFVITNGEPDTGFVFYFDGILYGAWMNGPNINHILNNYNINNNLKTKPLIIGGCNGQSKDKTPDHTFVRAIDELRIWDTYRTMPQIVANMNKTHLLDPHLVGYWDFDDERNRLDFVSDESFKNNSGMLKNGAAFIPENTNLFTTSVTTTVKSSNTATDSISLSLYDEDQVLISSKKQKTQNHQVDWTFDPTSLPYNVKKLVAGEHFPGCPAGGQLKGYNMHVEAPVPLATPMCNWGAYYQSDTDVGGLYNSILVNGLPENTSKVELGLKSGNNTYNADVFTLNSVPYQYGLTLNGTDNYIKTANQLGAPSTYEISLWFKTTTTHGGMLIGFSDSPDGVPFSELDRKLVMRKDGSLYFCFSRDGVHTDSLFAANKYNDGFWHCATVNVNSGAGASLAVDGCYVDENQLSGYINYLGYWVIGRHHQTVNPAEYAEYFQGSLAYINIFTSSKSQGMENPRDLALLNGAHRGNLVYRLDEGGGTTIHDTQGNNTGTLMGTAPNWTKTSKITDVLWHHNMIDKAPGLYTFYAKVYYPGGGESGVYYPLGIYNILDPLPGHNFSYSLVDGVGYFNEGVILYNWLQFSTDYTGHGNPGWTSNVVRYVFMSPDHHVISQGETTWTTNGNNLKVSIDMGDAPPGSYLDIQIGYKTSSQTNIVSSFPVPILIRQMLAPKITGNFGPFTQAVAPGTMKQLNTFTIATGEYNDLTKITADFFDPAGVRIATAIGTKVNNTTWTIGQDMSLFPPPQTTMTVSYYLGASQFLALEAGPYKIPINKSRPSWFNFLPDSAFSSIHEYADSVTFQITTPFENNNIINNSVEFDVPEQVPLIGGSSASLDSPGAKAYLKYLKSTSKLVLDQPPDFFQKYVNLGAGNGEFITVGFNFGQSNSYELDQYENLIASQNFTMGGSLSSGFSKFEGIVTKIKELVEFIENSDPESVIVKPSFSLGYTGSFQYSSRIRLMIDTTTGQWGSTGNLEVDADPDHTEAYHNSASYHFYAGSLGVEFSIGMEVFEGIVSGNFGFDSRIVMGYGHAYKTIPSFQKKPLKALKFESYCRFYVDVFWGWYEQTLWGPKMIYTHNFWDDDLDNVFPPGKKSIPAFELPTGLTEENGLVTNFRQVSGYSAIPMAKPQSSLIAADNTLNFNWLEKGDDIGKRILQSRFLDLSTQKFSDLRTMADNFNAPNHPVSDISQEGISILVWSQSRHDNLSFAATGNENYLEEFSRSQDIYYSVYATESDSVIQSGILEDDVLTYTSGRAEGNPQVVMLSQDRGLVTWQVVNPEIPQADIWYAFIDRQGTNWITTVKGVAFSEDGIESRIELTGAGDGRAVMAWKNTTRDSSEYSTIKASYFDGNQWSSPQEISKPGDVRCNYLDLDISEGTGALVYTVFIEDIVNGHHEIARLVPYNTDQFNPGETLDIFKDTLMHLQLPSLAVQSDGKVALAMKRERLTKKTENEKISQLDIFQGDLNDLSVPWLQIIAHPLVCDTNMQVSELNLAFAGPDKLIVLSQEYPAYAANTAHTVQNGIFFGDPYMNLVLRSFKINDNNEMEDVDENQYFLGIREPVKITSGIEILRCYPNPCRDHTTLTFSLTRDAHIKAEICDIQGNIISNLIDLTMESGYYEMDINTISFQSGIYLIRLYSDLSVVSYKLIINN